ncbi:helix-turn-helix domain-containing protein [Pedobacter sp. SYSU D00535]|uniref:helix-turn-helix domain-containing protein n=1 Tax=Pedobacter sp. SYSU D00535 TaxID=2810308 RepID=UPI001A978D2C|nr:helix-turn-helix domain-containing protein [Pedobacter sp. SYSU D00535]
MKYQTIAPSAPLAPYVRFFWIFESNTASVPYVYRSVADGCAELLFHYKGTFQDLNTEKRETSPLALIHAQTSRPSRFLTNTAFGIFGVYLYPFAIPRLFGLPSSVLTSQLVCLQTLLGQAGTELEERILTAGDNISRVKILSSFLVNCLKHQKKSNEAIEAAVLYAIHRNCKISVKALSAEFCLSERQFERRFKELSGFTPKTYLKIIRFQEAIKTYGGKVKSLSEIAHACGYYDQSHFIHDFKSFSGYHPRQYFRGGAEGTDYRD